MDWTLVAAIAKIIKVIPTAWKGVCKLLAYVKGDVRYSRLSSYERDVLKTLHQSETTRISQEYDDKGAHRMYTVLDCILSAPVACRLVVNRHYQESLKSLAERGLLQVDMPWRYAPSQRNMQAYRLTVDGKQFICKYHTGLSQNRVERFIRKWFKGLNRHKCKGCFSDKVGDDARRKLPNVLKGHVWLKEYYRGAKRLGEDDLMEPSIYEYPPGSREDGVECMVEIPLHDMDVDVNDSVFIFIRADVESNKPRHLHSDPKVTASTGNYAVQAKVVSIGESNSPVGTVLKLSSTLPFYPAVEIGRQSKEF